MILKNKLKKIIEAIEDTDIRSIEISSFWGAQKIKLSKDSNKDSINVVNQDSNPKESIAKAEDIKTNDLDIESSNQNQTLITEDISSDKNLIEIKAPLVGTFYISPKPGEPQFVNVGDKISKGHSICIIEAMKIFNEIESEHSGEIVDILIQDGQPVEYDQVLFTLKPE